MQDTMRQPTIWPMLHHGTHRWHLVTLVTYHGMHASRGICPMVQAPGNVMAIVAFFPWFNSRYFTLERIWHGNSWPFPQLVLWEAHDISSVKNIPRYESVHGRSIRCPTANPRRMPCMRTPWYIYDMICRGVYNWSYRVLHGTILGVSPREGVSPTRYCIPYDTSHRTTGPVVNKTNWLKYEPTAGLVRPSRKRSLFRRRRNYKVAFARNEFTPTSYLQWSNTYS